MNYYIKFNNINTITNFYKQSVDADDIILYNKIKNDIDKLPINIIKRLTNNNVEIWITDKSIIDNNFNNEEQDFQFKMWCHYYIDKRIIFLYKEHLKQYNDLQICETIYHEIGHAIDHISNTNNFYSLNIPNIKIYVQLNGIHYDKNPEINVREFFAEKFKDYLLNKNKLFKEDSIIYENIKKIIE